MGWPGAAMLELENMMQESSFAIVSRDFYRRNCRGKTPAVATVVILLPRDNLKLLVAFLPSVRLAKRGSVFQELLIDSFHN